MAPTSIDGSQTTETEQGRMEAIFAQFEACISSVEDRDMPPHSEMEAIASWATTEDGDRSDLFEIEAIEHWAASEDGQQPNRFEIEAVEVWAAT